MEMGEEIAKKIIKNFISEVHTFSMVISLARSSLWTLQRLVHRNIISLRSCSITNSPFTHLILNIIKQEILLRHNSTFSLAAIYTKESVRQAKDWEKTIYCKWFFIGEYLTVHLLHIKWFAVFYFRDKNSLCKRDHRENTVI